MRHAASQPHPLRVRLGEDGLVGGHEHCSCCCHNYRLYLA